MEDGIRVPVDAQALLIGLVESARRVLPRALFERVLVVERHRTLADRVAGRPGAIVLIGLSGADERLELAPSPGREWRGEAVWVYDGVVVARRGLPLSEWLEAFADRIEALAAEAAGADAASSRALQVLGLEPAGSEVRVRDGELERDLRTLPARLGGRAPAEARALVARIGELLAEALARVAGQGEAEVIVRRTATVYLPETLRAYLALPADWAEKHLLPDGTTPAQALVGQLTDLLGAAQEMRDAAAEHDATALLVNGRFLSERFARSRLDLP